VAQQIETLLTPVQTAAILQVKPNTLAKWRVTGEGLFKPCAENPMEPAAAFPKPRRSKRALRKSRHLPGELCPSAFPLPH
jgi:hypothetical protein